MIQVLLVDDQRLMRDGLKTLLSLEQDLEVCAVAENGAEAVHLVDNQPVDVVLMDIRMPVQGGIEATREIVQHHPHVKILMLTTFEERADVVDALSAGAVGYLLKDMPVEEIAAAIRVAFSGGAVLPPSVAKTLLTTVQQADPTQWQEAGAPECLGAEQQKLISGLTEREVDVLHCLAKGMSNREIGDQLYVTEGTVKNHVSSLIGKLELRDRTQVALFAVRHGFGKM